jgi:hypothetical protein
MIKICIDNIEYIMSNENWFGRDADEGAMAIDRRPLKEQLKALLTKLLGSKQAIDPTAPEEEGQTDELFHESV